jgi:hypothetical protein
VGRDSEKNREEKNGAPTGDGDYEKMRREWVERVSFEDLRTLVKRNRGRKKRGKKG